MVSSNSQEIKIIGLVGLGLMGQGICSCLIANGFHVIAYSRTAAREQEAVTHIARECRIETTPAALSIYFIITPP